jgi:hypothetical protein
MKKHTRETNSSKEKHRLMAEGKNNPQKTCHAHVGRLITWTEQLIHHQRLGALVDLVFWVLLILLFLKDWFGSVLACLFCCSLVDLFNC